MTANRVLFTINLLSLPLLGVAVRIDISPGTYAGSGLSGRRMDWIDIEQLMYWNDPCYQYSWTNDQRTWSCGDEMCQCTHTVADCSRHGANLTYIPPLPDGISHLDFSQNYVSFERDFFINITGISHLDISGCRLYNVSANAFDLLANLTYLVLYGNSFTYTQLAPVFSIKKLTYLDISFNDLGEMPDDLFDIYHAYQLETLCLSYNDIKTVNMHTFMPLPKLKNLDLGFNLLSSQTFRTDNAYLPQLIHLNLMFNAFYIFLSTCENNTSVFPNLTELLLGDSSLTYMHEQPICLPSVQHISIGYALIKELQQDTFSDQFFPSLQSLNFDHDPNRLQTIAKYAFRNTAMKNLYFFNGYIDFSSHTVDAECFAGCPSLSVLSLDNNDFDDVSDDKFSRLFSSIPRLTHLKLKNCQIGHVSPGMFSDMKQVKVLSLDSNKLTSIPDGTFDGLERLISLTLSRNRIPIIKESTFSAMMRTGLVSLDISNNPFSCSCELRWFQRWLTTDGRIQVSGPYRCDNMANTTVQEFYVVDQSCLLNPETSKFMIATIVMILLALSVCTTIYRYRWHLRLILYDVVRGPEERWRRLQRLQQPFKYDIFVSFDSEDLDWVRAHLMPELERKLGLKLCIHERDFIPGKHIVDNIADCVKASKKVMMLFSSNFAKSQWCQFELAMCLSHVLETDDVLLIVMLHDVPSRDLTAAMMVVMKTTTYIEWADEPEASASFWGRMQIALNEILPAV